MSEKRKKAWRYGRLAETAASALLILKGYRVLDRRVRTPAGEIDLVVQRGNLVAFVEVKARRNHAEAAESLGPRQRERIARAAEAYLAGHPPLAGCDVRFDVVLMGSSGLPAHLEDAWRPEA
jgi:putative endonuclease